MTQANKVLDTYNDMVAGKAPDALCWDALKEMAECVLDGANPTTEQDEADEVEEQELAEGYEPSPGWVNCPGTKISYRVF